MSRSRKHQQRFRHRDALVLILALGAILVAAIYAVSNTTQPTSNQENLPRAVIVDQLATSYPNSTFWQYANSLFNKSRWNMTYHAGGLSVDNVDFYRALPQRGFKIVILRVHAALNPETQTLALFTGEEWDDLKASTTYISDFDLVNPTNNKLAKVRVSGNSIAYFGITPNFVEAMKGDFDNATIIMMGCDGLTNKKMAEAFLQKGAKAYIGWTGPVSADHTDAATQQLLEHLITENKTIAEAVKETLDQVGKDPTYNSTLSYYSKED